MKYRDWIENSLVVAEQEDIDSEVCFLTSNEAFNIIRDIEDKVNDVLCKVEKISGLTEIDEIKDDLKSLSNDLY